MNKLTSNTESRLEGLNKSEEKYQALFNSIDEGVCTIEIIFDEHEKAIDFRIIDINPAGIKLTGLNQDIVGKRIREILPGFQECNIEHFGQVVLSGKSIRLEEYVSALDSWFSYFALPNGGESSHEIAVIFQNITERKR
ncbi:MAG TPA: PAS domain-containing protein, partial [Candidatus Moranbacteria bacterium]|nr:PAS domain-containing protein [Candidatus Moranbacteria bacterium]